MQDFQGGQDPTVHILTDAELSNFKNLLVSKLKTAALDGIKEKMNSENAATGKSFDILDIPENVVYGEPTIELLDGAKTGDKRSVVTLS